MGRIFAFPLSILKRKKPKVDHKQIGLLASHFFICFKNRSSFIIDICLK